VTYFYCSLQDECTLQPSTILATILKQIIGLRHSVTESAIAAFERLWERGMPSGHHFLASIKAHLFHIMKSGGVVSLFIITDGLDECPIESRGELLQTLVEITNHKYLPAIIKVLISSRKAPDIDFKMDSFPTIPIRKSDTSSDIAEYVRSAVRKSITTSKPLRQPVMDDPKLEDRIVDTPISQADGI
jgi:hypothetical protein